MPAFTCFRSRATAPVLLLLCSCAAGTTDGIPDAGPTPVALGLNDVSILYPVPPRVDAAGWMRPGDDGGRGELLPRKVFDGIGGFPVASPDELSFTRMRVLAVRFDACGGARGGCIAMVRLVMQPVDNGGMTRDSALHLFYRLTRDEMAGVVAELRSMQALAPGAGDGPLDVHPALVEQGVEGAYGEALRALVLSHCGSSNLFKLTFFLRAPPLQEVWFFGGFEVDGETMTALDIVGVGEGNQQVIRPEVAGGYEYTFNPVGDTPEDGTAFLSSAAAAAADEEERRAAMASYLRVENPVKRVVDELPCAGCHVSTFVVAQNASKYALAAADFPDDAYTSSRDLTVKGNAASNPSSLRAFGWFKDEPMVSQRTVNETDAVLDYIEANFP